jgi:hypothetical protein
MSSNKNGQNFELVEKIKLDYNLLTNNFMLCLYLQDLRFVVVTAHRKVWLS